MKTFKYFLFAFIAAFAAVGCSDDPTYTPGDADDPNSYGVYFPSQSNARDVELDPADPTVLEFKAMRRNTKDAIIVPVEVTSSEQGLFTVSEIKFEAGQAETTFTVSFDGAEIGNTYKCSLLVSDKRFAHNYTEYSNGLTFSVTRVQWVLVKGKNGETKGKWRDDFFTSMLGAVNIKEGGIPNAEKDIEIYERPDMPGYYRIKDIYDDAFMYKICAARYSDVHGVATYTIIDARDKDKVYFPVQSAGFQIEGYDDNGMLVIVSMCKENYPTLSSATRYGKLENGIITFPDKAILCSLPSLWEAGSYYKANTSMTRIMLPGAVDYDYSVVLSSAAPADGKVEITATLGADVAKMKYAYFEGELSTSVIASKAIDIDAETVPSEEIAASGTITAEMEKTGIYTLVGVTYNAAGVQQKYAGVTFGYVKAGEEKPVVLSLRTELTWEYEAQGYTPENSVKGIVFGEDIKSGKYGLLKTDLLKGKTQAELESLIQKSGNVISEANLAKINGNGWAPFFVDLDKGTSYTLLVWADNGYNGKLFAADQVTAGAVDPMQKKYTVDDLYIFGSKDELFKTWDLWGINNDGSNNPDRTELGQVTFSENTDADTDQLDAVNVSGLSLGANADDTVVWEYYQGILYVLKGQPMGTVLYQNQTLYLKYYILDKTSGMGADTIDGMMVGGLTEDGYLALVCSPTWNKDYNFDTFLARAYTDQTYKTSIGNWQSYTAPLMVEAGANSGASVAKKSVSEKLLMLSHEISIDPSNYVELRGRERAHALIDQMMARRPKMSIATLEGTITSQAVTPVKNTFSNVIVRPVGDGRIHIMPLQRVVE